MTLTDHDRDLARAALRRFAVGELSPAELAIEIERWEQERDLLAGDLAAGDETDAPLAVLEAGIAYAEHRLAELERQARRFLRSQAKSRRLTAGADFSRVKYVDLVGLAQTLIAEPGRKLANGHYLLRCPFHDGDREPSLRIYPPGRGWHCFGCGRGGQDAASFCAEFFGCSQLEGLRWVEQLADGVRETA